jgi:hypothetical protein
MVAGDAAGSLETLVNDGWNHHDTESERLARELEAAADNGVAVGILAPFIHLSVHTIGEHLGDWERALKLGKRRPGAGCTWPPSLQVIPLKRQFWSSLVSEVPPRASAPRCWTCVSCWRAPWLARGASARRRASMTAPSVVAAD